MSIVILGPNLEILFRGGDPHQGREIEGGPGAPPENYTLLKTNLRRHRRKGLLGGLKAPPAAAEAVSGLRRGQVAAVVRAVRKLPDSGETGKFKRTLLKRLEALRVRKRELFEALEKAGEEWRAYKAGSSYLRCFPDARDRSEVRKKLGELGRTGEVKRNLEAREAFARAAAKVHGPKSTWEHNGQADAIFGQLAEKYRDTEYGRLAAEMVE